MVDAIKTFDVDTQRTLYAVKEIRMLPAREFPLDEPGRARFRSRWRELFEGDPSKKRLYRDVSNGVGSGSRSGTANTGRRTERRPGCLRFLLTGVAVDSARVSVCELRP